MLFSRVAQVFDSISASSARLDKTAQLAQLFKEASPEEAEIIANLALGQLHAPHIGTQFNVAEKIITRAIAAFLQVDDASVAATIKTSGDVGLLFDQQNWDPAQSFSVQEVYDALSALEAISGSGAQEEKMRALGELIGAVDNVSAKYIVRIVFGKLRLGFSDMTIIDALSWMQAGNKSFSDEIESAYNICADIGRIARVLKADGMQTIEHMNIVVGIPIRPAAAERLPTARAIVEKLGNCVAQPKLDGFRLQLHMDKSTGKPVIHFYSRNLQDMSAMFPDIAHAFAQLHVDNIICEGEAIVYDANAGTFLPFQETVKRKRKHGVEEAAAELPLYVYLFDILYVNSESMLDKTHAERRKKLLELFNHEHFERILPIEEIAIDTPEQLEEYFAKNISAGLEGLVVKRPDSTYQAGNRNFNWIKLKRQESGHLEDTIDAVILGYYAGRGKRAQFGIGAFLVGVYNKQQDCFETVAKVGTGLSDLEWVELKQRCDAVAVKEQPADVVCHKQLAPDVWCYPEMVCLIRADEITMSPVHTAGKTDKQLGYALRFPRFMGYRPDKSADQATEVIEVEHLYKDQFAATE